MSRMFSHVPNTYIGVRYSCFGSSVGDRKVSDRSMYDHLQVSGQNADLLDDQSGKNNYENYNLMCYLKAILVI